MQEFLAFRWQSKGDCNHQVCFTTLIPNQSRFVAASTIWTTKLFFSAVAGIVDAGGCAAFPGVGDPGGSPTIDDTAARNSDSRLDGRSTRTLSLPLSARPFLEETTKRV